MARHYLHADKYVQQIEGGDHRSSRMENSRHQTDVEWREGPTEDGELLTYIPKVDRWKNDGAPYLQTSTIFCRNDAPVNRISSSA